MQSASNRNKVDESSQYSEVFIFHTVEVVFVHVDVSIIFNFRANSSERSTEVSGKLGDCSLFRFLLTIISVPPVLFTIHSN